MTFKLKNLGLLFVLLSLASCGPLIDLPGSGDAPKHFELNAPSNFPVTLEYRDWTIQIEDVSASGSLRTNSIMVKTGANSVEYYKEALWADRTPRLIGRHLLETIENSGKFKVLANESLDLPSDVRLRVDVREFAAFPDEGKVKVRLSAILLRASPSEIISQRQFFSEMSLRGQDVESAVLALNKAMDDLSLEILGWIVNPG